MPKLVVNAFLTLDGVMQAPGAPDEDHEGGFAHGGWQAPYLDDVMGRLVTEGIADADGFLLGRKTYDIFARYWPGITDPNNSIATALNSRPKYVVSRSLDRVTSEQLQPDPGRRGRRAPEAPAAARPGRAHVGQHRPAPDAAEARPDRRDRLFIVPVVLGSGKRLFGSGTVPLALEQVESVTTGRGVTYHRFERAGRPEYGRVGA